MRIPEIAREITKRWISEVPSRWCRSVPVVPDRGHHPHMFWDEELVNHDPVARCSDEVAAFSEHAFGVQEQ
jgi:hypothetical protein